MMPYIFGLKGIMSIYTQKLQTRVLIINTLIEIYSFLLNTEFEIQSSYAMPLFFTLFSRAKCN